MSDAAFGRPLSLAYVVWDPQEREEQLARWRSLVEALPQRIAAVRAAPRPVFADFFESRVAIFLFDANRLEGTISASHQTGKTIQAIQRFLSGAAPEPEPLPWNSEGGREFCHPSSQRQLYQAARACTFLLRENRTSPLTLELLLEAHRLMVEGSYVDDPAKPLAAGRFRREEGEKVFAGTHQFVPPQCVEAAVRKLVEEYEARRTADNENPVALAIYLFYTLITIHPFMNGNGRLCRLFLAWSLLRDGFPFPVSFSSGRTQPRRNYLHAIERARGVNHRESRGSFGELNVTALVSMDRVLSAFACW